MSKKFDIHEWQAKIRLAEQTMTNFGPAQSVTKYNGLPIRDNVMDYANQILQQIKDYENNVGPGEVPIDYSGTIAAAEALMDAVDRDEEDMDTIAQNAMSEVEVTGMEPSSGNMEKEYRVIGPQNKNEPLDNVSIEYKGEVFVLDFEEGDVIDDHGNEGKDMTFVAYSDDNKYRFIVDVSVDANYDRSDIIQDIYWDTLEIDVDDSMVNTPEDMDEQNSLGAAGSGASFKAGKGIGYMSPMAFSSRKNRVKKK